MKITISWGAKNTGATFGVKAGALEDALDVLSARDEWGKFDGKFTFDATDVNGDVTAVVVKPTFTITMPSWPDAGKQPKACKAEWDRMFAALKKHEEGHRKIFEDGIKTLETKLKALKSATQSDISDLMDEARADIQTGHNTFDTSTDHGAKQGVDLTIDEECESKK